jgi:hypothetical protein
MRDRTSLLVFVAVLAVLGVRYLPPSQPAESKPATKEGSGQSPRSEPDGSPSAPRGGKRSKGREFLQPLRDFLNRPANSTIDLSKLDNYDVEFLIVTLPDPVDSTSGWRFDAHVDAIQRAVETQDLVLDRFWYPWRANNPIDASASSDPGEAAKGEDNKPYQRGVLPQERQPGVLLFRPVPPPPKPDRQSKKNQQRMALQKNLLMVFLVGETATQGVHKGAFTECLEFIQKSPNYEETKTVRILGPAFSGSRRSLEIALSQWCKKNKQASKVTIISGSATNIDKIAFEAWCKDECEGAVVTFQATVHREELILNALFDYCGGRRVAVLSEANTVFGQNAVGEEHNILRLPFPLHISDVRTAISKGAKGEPASNLPVFGNKLPIPLEESGDPRDTEPSLTPAMTEVATEQILRQILTSISQEHISYVLISASELKDKLFLASLIRQHCPDVQLLLSGSDLLLTHPNYRADLKGTIVASTYPLYLANQHWTYPFGGSDRHLLFPGQQEQGYYNATIALLADDAKKQQKMLEYGVPFKQQPEGGTRHPPVWMSILGQNGPHPLDWRSTEPATEEVLAASTVGLMGSPFGPGPFPAVASALFPRNYIFEARAPSVKSGPDSHHHTTFWFAPGGAVILLVIIVCVPCIVAYYKAPLKAANNGAFGEWVEIFGREMNENYQYRFFFCLAPMAVLSFSLATTCWSHIAHQPGEFLDWLAVLLSWAVFTVTIVVLLLFLFTPSYRLLRESQELSQAQSRRRFLVVLFPVVLTAILAAALRGCAGEAWWGDKAAATLYYARASGLSCGVSPVLPVLFLGLAFFCMGIMLLKRRYFLKEPHRVEVPFSSERICGPIGEIRDILDHPYRNLRTSGLTWVALAILLFALYQIGDRFISTAEGNWYDVTFMLCAGVFAVILVIVALYTRLFWKSLHALLRQIVLLPLAPAFDRIPPSVISLFGPYLSSPRPSRQASRTLRCQQLSAVVTQFDCGRADLESQLRPDEAEVFTELRLERLGERGPVPPDEASYWEGALRRAASTCLRALAHFWAARPLDEAFASQQSGREEAGEQTENVATPAGRAAGTQQIDPVCQWVRTAEDFVAIEAVNYLSQFFVQLRNLVTSLTVGTLLLFLAMVSYPFQPQRLLLTYLGVLVVCLATGAMWIFLQIEKDELVSRVLKTTPNRISFHPTFVSSVLTYVVPLLGVLALLSNDLSDLLHSLLDPVFKLIK